MKQTIIPLLCCPHCLPDEVSLELSCHEENEGDIEQGNLHCPACRHDFAIRDGIALFSDQVTEEQNKYEQDEVVSSYLWSHYGDLLGDEQASDAYQQWAGLIAPFAGLALNLGGSVGRFTFELAGKGGLAVGVDTSLAFIRTARQLMKDGRISFELKEEGQLRRPVTIQLPDTWPRQHCEFIVADAQRLPFGQGGVATLASLNLVDKLPQPRQHLQELNRLAQLNQAQLLLSDPFSWSREVAEPEQWLGGTEQGEMAGHGLDNIASLLCNGPGWQESKRHHVWWKIRSHRNHYELIRSCYIKMER